MKQHDWLLVLAAVLLVIGTILVARAEDGE